MIKWEFYTRRRKISLQEFVAHCGTLTAAIDHFNRKGVSLPKNGELKTLYSETSSDIEENVPDLHQEDESVEDEALDRVESNNRDETDNVDIKGQTPSKSFAGKGVGYPSLSKNKKK